MRNAKVNRQLQELRKRLAAEAPDVIRFYLQHNGAFYVRAQHQLDLLVRDAEAMRTQWATGRQVTDKEARDLDQHDGKAAKWNRLIEKAK